MRAESSPATLYVTLFSTPISGAELSAPMLRCWAALYYCSRYANIFVLTPLSMSHDGYMLATYCAWCWLRAEVARDLVLVSSVHLIIITGTLQQCAQSSPAWVSRGLPIM